MFSPFEGSLFMRQLLEVNIDSDSLFNTRSNISFHSKWEREACDFQHPKTFTGGLMSDLKSGKNVIKFEYEHLE